MPLCIEKGIYTMLYLLPFRFKIADAIKGGFLFATTFHIHIFGLFVSSFKMG